MPSPFLLGNLFSSVGLLCPEVPQHGCAASLFTHLSAGGAGRMLVLGGCYCSTPTSSHSRGSGQDFSVLQEVAGLTEASVRVVSHGCHPSQWREPGPSCRQSLAASCGESRGLCVELSHRAAAAAEGRAALSLPPSCGAQQPLGRIPAAGSDNLTQQAELGALSSSKHSSLR